MAIIIIDGDESVYDIDELSYDHATEKEKYKSPLIIVSFGVRSLCGALREVSFAQSANYFGRVRRASLEGGNDITLSYFRRIIGNF